jgi:hypothetical protein
MGLLYLHPIQASMVNIQTSLNLLDTQSDHIEERLRVYILRLANRTNILFQIEITNLQAKMLLTIFK